jgi:TetR/AcrR family transcriptional regulator, regulator of cefoperazone and chloramphenicol sensitivity
VSLSKGDVARGAILRAALETFGRDGFKATTTRDIAERAGVSLPALKYYFGNKEGLYLAGATEIVERFEREFGHLEAPLRAELKAGMTPAHARARLKLTMSGLVDFLLASHESEVWRLFVLREMSEPGPAFEVLFQNIWSRGIDICSALIGCILRKSARSAPVRIEALLMISNVTAFERGRVVALRALGWDDLGGRRLATIKEVIENHIDRLG